MIVLESIDPRRRCMALRQVVSEQNNGSSMVGTVSKILDAMGESGLQIIEHTPPKEDSDLEHEWWLGEDGAIEYRARFPQDRNVAASINIYTAAALATYAGDGKENLTQLRIAIYELCVNVLEHGNSIRDNAEVVLGIRLASDVISGSIQDQCEHFNPLDQPREELEDLLLRRATRGYGLWMATQIFDELDYAETETGNLVRFTKRMVR